VSVSFPLRNESRREHVALSTLVVVFDFSRSFSLIDKFQLKVRAELEV
jgi:hypothetical protein